MRKLQVRIFGGAAVPLAVLGCAVVNPHADYEHVNERVLASTGFRAVSPRDDDAAVRALIDERLGAGLTAAEALELCLLNNPRVRAAYLRVGVARADVVQAGLFRNPSLSLSLRLPDSGGLANLQADLAQNIADLWLIPARMRAAESELQRTTLDVAREIGVAAHDTRGAYYAALAADRECEIADQNRALARQLVDVALARQSAGVGSEIDANLSRAEFMQTELASKAAELVAFEARRRLLVLLGLALQPGELVLSDKLPDAPMASPSSARLVEIAERTRIDLVAADYLVEEAAALVEQEQRSVFANVEVGMGFERAERGRRGDRPWLADTAWAMAEAGGPAAPSFRAREKLPTDIVLGPAVSLELPIFDQNQAQIARAEFLHRAASANRAALLLDVTQETRAALKRAETAWDVARYYRDQFLPLLEKNLDVGREAYRAGKLSLLSVLEAQKSLLTARSRYVQALRDSSIALADLEKAVGVPGDRILSEAAAPSDLPVTNPAIGEVRS